MDSYYLASSLYHKKNSFQKNENLPLFQRKLALRVFATFKNKQSKKMALKLGKKNRFFVSLSVDLLNNSLNFKPKLSNFDSGNPPKKETLPQIWHKNLFGSSNLFRYLNVSFLYNFLLHVCSQICTYAWSWHHNTQINVNLQP